MFNEVLLKKNLMQIEETSPIKGIDKFNFNEDFIINLFTNYISLFEFSKLQLVDKKWNKIINSLYPYALFKIMKIISNHSIGELMKCADVVDKDANLDLIETNCFYNMLAVSIFASGLKNVDQLFDDLYESYTLVTKLSIPVFDKLLNINISLDNVLSGPLIVSLNNKSITKDDDKELAAKYKELSKDFLCYLLSIVNECEYKKSNDFEYCKRKSYKKLYYKLNHLKYDFNKYVIDSLLSESLIKNNEVSKKLSFIYYLTILMPNPYKHEQDQFEYSSYHTLTIEQFFSSQKNKGMFRIYQSNFQKMSLQKYTQQKGYEIFSDEGCIDYDGLKSYFIDFKSVLKGKKQDFEGLCFRCFGSSLTRQPRLSYYNIKTSSLEGFSLRYRSESFNPKNSINNLLEFLNKQNQNFALNLEGI